MPSGIYMSIGFILGAASALIGMWLGARLTWRTTGHEGPIITDEAVPAIDQDSME